MLRKDLTGKQFTYLTVKEFSHMRSKNSYWKCTCVCGKETIISRCSLIQGATRSCGCKVGELNLENRIASRINICESGCWEWTGSKSGLQGYGKIKHRGKSKIISRFCFNRFVYQVPDHMLVCHTCDNPICMNPDHLFLGTPQENLDDAVKKERMFKGSKHRFSKLNEEDIPKIRALFHEDGLSQTAISKIFKVGNNCIHKVIRGQTWKYI